MNSCFLYIILAAVCVCLETTISVGNAVIKLVSIYSLCLIMLYWMVSNSSGQVFDNIVPIRCHQISFHHQNIYFGCYYKLHFCIFLLLKLNKQKINKLPKVGGHWQSLILDSRFFTQYCYCPKRQHPLINCLHFTTLGKWIQGHLLIITG